MDSNLLKEQKPWGGWYGRWGMNYVYGTSNVLNGLRYYYDGGDEQIQRAIFRAVNWMQARQNADGGFGESVRSYGNDSLAGCGLSTATQTAWALMALLPYLHTSNSSIERGVKWLFESQIKLDESKSTWSNGSAYTSTGFPGHLYLEYDYYRHYFPVMALGRYVDMVSASKKDVGYYYRSLYTRDFT